MSTFRHATMLNAVGMVVLFLGIGSAGILYWLGQDHSPSQSNRPAASDWQDSTLSLPDSKTATRNIELYGGRVEVLMVKWLEWVRRPESLAILITTMSALVALGCFLLARRFSSDP